MKGHYSFIQTMHIGPQQSVPLPVKHDYPGAVPMGAQAREDAYVKQNGGRFASGRYGLTARQARQLDRMLLRNNKLPRPARAA